METSVTVYNIGDLIFELQKIRHKNPNIALGFEMPETGTVDLEHGIHLMTTSVITFKNEETECLLIK